MDCDLIRHPNDDVNKARIYFTKSDYLKIGEYIESLAREQFASSELVECKFSYRNDGFSATCSSEEFKRIFSSNDELTELSIFAQIPATKSMISFHTDSLNYGGIYVYMKSNQHTQIEVEDTLASILSFVELCALPYMYKNNQLPEDSNSKSNTQPDSKKDILSILGKVVAFLSSILELLRH